MRRFFFLVGAIVLLAALPGTLQRELTVSRSHSDLFERRIYAYRDWQSSGVRINRGDRVAIEAQGEWFYTPDEYHGPAGHPVFLAPSFYPVPHRSGGVLIGRVGEEGEPFAVGEGISFHALEQGILYLRINDDSLSDNDGWVAVQIDVTETQASIP